MSTRSPKRDTIGSNTLKVRSGTASSFSLDLNSVVPASSTSNISGIYEVAVNPEGDRIYLVNSSSVILQYKLPNPNGSIRDMVLEKQSNTNVLGLSGSIPDSLTFSEDGTKLFVTHTFAGGGTVPDIRRYSLGSPFDIGNISLDGGANTINMTSARNSGFQFNTEVPRDLIFNKEGTVAFLLESGIVTGPFRGQVLKVNLRQPWDLTTAYNTFNKYLAQDINAMRFVDNGNKMIVLNGTTDNLLEYTLPNPYEHYNANLTANLQLKKDLFDITPVGFDLSQDGSKLYILDVATDSIIQYELSSPWQISTGAINLENAPSIRIATEETTPSGLTFSDDGNYMYAVGYNSDRLHQYSLSEAWNPNTATNIAALIIGSQDTTPYSLYYGNSGYSIYLHGATGDDVNQYNMTVPGDITTATFAGVGQPSTWGATGSRTTPATNTVGMTFSPDGKTIYISQTDNAIRPYNLARPWDITSVYDFELRFMQAASSNPRGLRWGNAGYNLYYLVGSAAANVIQYSLPAPYVGGGVYEKHFNPLPSPPSDTSGSGMTLSEDGSNLYIVGVTYDNISQYKLTTPWDIGTAVYEGNLNVLPVTSNPDGIRFNPEGNLAYVISSTTDRIHQFELGIPWMISTASNVAARIISATESVGTDLYIANNGITLFTIGDSVGGVAEWAMSTPWDITTANPVSGRTVTTEGTATTVDFRPDGKVFVSSGVVSDSTIMLYMPNAWVVPTAYDAFRDPNLTRQFYSPRWSNTGTTLFVVDRSSGSQILQYKANVAYDIFSIDYVNQADIPAFNPGNFDSVINAIDISKDNRYLYILGEVEDSVRRFEFLDPINPRVDQLKFPVKNLSNGTTNFTEGGITVLPNGNIMVIIPSVTGVFGPKSIRAGVLDFNLGDGNVWTMTNVYSNIYTATTASSGDTAPSEIRFVDGGYRALILGTTSDDVTQHDLSQPYNIATARRDTGNTLSLDGTISTLVSAIDVSHTGEWLFAGDTTADSVYRYTMRTANSLSGATSNNLSGLSIFDLNIYETESYLGSSPTNGHAGIEFNEDGTKMFYCSAGRNVTNESSLDGNAFIFEFNLPEPYDIGGATPSGNQLPTRFLNRAGRISSIAFSRDGKTMYMVDNQTPGRDGGTRLSQIYFIDKNTLYNR